VSKGTAFNELFTTPPPIPPPRKMLSSSLESVHSNISERRRAKIDTANTGRMVNSSYAYTSVKLSQAPRC